MVNVEKEDLRVLVGDHNLYTISNSQKAIKVTAAGVIQAFSHVFR